MVKVTVDHIFLCIKDAGLSGLRVSFFPVALSIDLVLAMERLIF